MKLEFLPNHWLWREDRMDVLATGDHLGALSNALNGIENLQAVRAMYDTHWTNKATLLKILDLRDQSALEAVPWMCRVHVVGMLTVGVETQLRFLSRALEDLMLSTHRSGNIYPPIHSWPTIKNGEVVFDSLDTVLQFALAHPLALAHPQQGQGDIHTNSWLEAIDNHNLYLRRLHEFPELAKEL